MKRRLRHFLSPRVVRGQTSQTTICRAQCFTIHARALSNSWEQHSHFSPWLSRGIPFNQQRVYSSVGSSSQGSTVDFILADIGEGIAEVEIMKWFVKEGDKVVEYDPICEVQSDKATVEITSRYDGVVTKICHPVGGIAEVGKPLITLTLSGSQASSSVAKPSSSPAQPSSSAAQSSSLPSAVSPSPTSDSIFKQSPEVQVANQKVLASPAVRKLGRDHNLDLSLIRPSGAHGRLLKEDVLNFLSGGSSPNTHVTPDTPDTPAVPSRPPPAEPMGAPPPMNVPTHRVLPSHADEDREMPLTGLTRAMSVKMTEAAAIPTFGYSDEMKMDALADVRALSLPLCEKFGVKLSYLAFMIKATSMALVEFPVLNSTVNKDCTAITYKADHNIGLAMDTPRGLLVPNIKRVQDRSIMEIGMELRRLSDLGKQAKLGKEDLEGGTITLSNIGSIGGTHARPILFVPQTVIGALGKIQTLPRYDEAMNLKPTKVVQVSWTADHRVIDGATVARFSNRIKDYVENPAGMLVTMD
eukprot:g44395.t1